MIEINAQTITFFLMSLFILGGGLGVVTTRNLIHGALYLILSLFGVAGYFVLLAAPFLAAVQVLVYIGAIAILIVFAVMLTRSMTSLRETINRQWWLSAIVGVLLFGFLTVGVIVPVWGQGSAFITQPISETVASTTDLGVALVDGNGFVLPFEVASILLTAAMIGAIVIARDDDK
jgi:NADH:ubiquinone oxidoreductase subunit 6 (subunit J)